MLFRKLPKTNLIMIASLGLGAKLFRLAAQLVVTRHSRVVVVYAEKIGSMRIVRKHKTLTRKQETQESDDDLENLHDWYYYDNYDSELDKRS